MSAPYTIWQCPDCGTREQHQAVDPASLFVYCRRASSDWERICGRRMVRMFDVTWAASDRYVSAT